MASAKSSKQKPDPVQESAPAWELRLYVAGQTPNSVKAFANLKRICEAHLKGKYHIEVVDLLQNPSQAKDDQIVAVPSVVRRLPSPVKKVLGDLSSEERVLVALEMQRVKTAGAGAGHGE